MYPSHPSWPPRNVATDDLQWFLTSRGGRDRLLRREVESLHASLSDASEQTTRLSSQLANLSGSIETRLNALSRAFDAYVELGDIREDLLAYEEPAAVRRHVRGAIEALAGGRPAAPIDPRDLDYWLPYAMNAVIGLVQDHPADDALHHARALAPEADLFVVAACGALGHGEAATDLLPTVLAADDDLTPHQQAVWRATTAGVFGDPADLPATAWRLEHDSTSSADWLAWVRSHTRTSATGIAWLHSLVNDPSSLPAKAAADSAVDYALLEGFASPPALSAGTDSDVDPRQQLRTVVSDLVGGGMPTEADLLRRARELRALIERPESSGATDAEFKPATVVSEVRRALLLPSMPPSLRDSLLALAAPDLLAVVDELTAAARAEPPRREVLRTGSGEMVVTSSGVDPEVIAGGVSRIDAAYRATLAPLIGWSAATGVAAMASLLLGLSGSGWAWLMLVGALICVVGTAKQVHDRRAARQARLVAVERLRREIAEATVRVDAVEHRRSASLVRLTGEARELHALLATDQQTALSPADDH